MAAILISALVIVAAILAAVFIPRMMADGNTSSTPGVEVEQATTNQDDTNSNKDPQESSASQESSKQESDAQEKTAETQFSASSIVNDFSNPFWGAFFYASQDKAKSEAQASKLTDMGYPAAVVKTSDWAGLNREEWYSVTMGTWSTETEALAAVAKLKDLGYSDAYSRYSGNKQAATSSSTDKGTTVTVKTKSGATLQGLVEAGTGGYVIDDSSTREYSVAELKALNLSDAELCIAWNEPFARLGYHFKNPGLRAYFESCSWYKDTGAQVTLTGAAATNNACLREIAEASSSAKLWEDLAEG